MECSALFPDSCAEEIPTGRLTLVEWYPSVSLMLIKIIVVTTIFGTRIVLKDRKAKMKKLVVILIACIHASTGFSQPEPKSFQASLFPMVGTDGASAGNNSYDISLNFFAGVVGAVNGFEAGAFLNLNLYYMEGMQLSGFGNLVNGHVDGLQAAGFFNVNKSHVNGLQMAGFVNVNGGRAEGFQMAGFANVNGDSFDGVQLSGFVNVIAKSAEAVQICGFGNAAGDEFTGLQLAGFGNIAGRISGGQIAGFINLAERVDGFQLGFINYADSISGIPIGFLSIVRDGYRRFEIGGSDALHVNASFRIGVPKLYNIFSAGLHLISPQPVWGIGYGIGTESVLSKDYVFNAELVHTYLHSNRWWRGNSWSALSQFRFNFGKALSERSIFFAGPTLNLLVSRANQSGEFEIPIVSGYHLYNYTEGRTNVRFWVGIHAGFRFK